MQTLVWDVRGQKRKLYVVFKVQAVLNEAVLLHFFFFLTIVKINNWGKFFEKNKQWLNNFWKRFDIK